MTRIPKHLLAASALLGAATLAVPALAQRGGMMERPHMSGSGMTGGHMDRGEVAQMCGRMTQGRPGGGNGGRPNQQWRPRAPASNRG